MSPTKSDAVRTLARTGTAARLAALMPPERELHRRVLRSFVASGEPPQPEDLRAKAAELDVDLSDALARLAEVDLVHTDGDGRIVVAYPFSGRQLGVTVRLDGATVDAMCAIDALGIPLMTGGDATISATDAGMGEPVRVEYRGGQWTWEPTSTVVLVAATRESGPSVECSCPLVRFYADASDARTELATHPEVHGEVLDQADAVEVARLCFGDLLGR